MGRATAASTPPIAPQSSGEEATDAPQPQLPSVGRIVHYGVENFDGGVEPHAAMITRISQTETAITLEVFHPEGGQDIQRAEYSPELAVGCWTWAPRV